MQILLTNNHLVNYGGSETWTHTMATVLKRLGHDVQFLTLHQGKVSKDLEEQGIPMWKGDMIFDKILANHNSCAPYVDRMIGHKTFTSHGLVVMEQPTYGFDRYVAVSEEVQANMRSQGFDSDIIRNPIDLERFTYEPEGEIIVSLTQSETAMRFVEQVAKELKMNYVHASGFRDVESIIRQAKYVFSLGRGAMEALCMGKVVYCYDHRPYMTAGYSDGILTGEALQVSLRNNFSGRAHKYIKTPKQVADELAAHERREEDNLLARRMFGANEIIKKYL